MSRAIDPGLTPTDDPTAHLSHPDALYEIVDGRVVEKPEMGAAAYLVAMNLFQELRAFLSANRLGRATFEAFFVIDPVRDVRRRPDVAFVSFERWPSDREGPGDGEFEVVPDLAVEVVSPSDPYARVIHKVREYFRHGVRQVWLISPEERLVQVYVSPKDVRVVEEPDVLEGGDLLPGFRVALGPLFRLTWE